MKPIDLQEIRRTIEKAAGDGDAAIVSRKWLESVERELQAGREAAAKLAGLRILGP